MLIYDTTVDDLITDGFIVDFVTGFRPTTLLIMESVVISVVIMLLITPVLDCNNFLEIMLKFEFLYMALVFLWLESTPESEQPKVIAIIILIAICCESVAGLTTLVSLRTVDKLKAIYTAHNNKLRG